MAQLQGPTPRGVPHEEFLRRKRAERRTDRGLTLLLGHRLTARGEAVTAAVCLVVAAGVPLAAGMPVAQLLTDALAVAVLVGGALLIGGVVAAVTIRRHGRPDADGRSIPAGHLVVALLAVVVVDAIGSVAEGIPVPTAVVGAVVTAAVVGLLLALVLLIVRVAARRS